MIETKTGKAKKLFYSGKIKEALKILKGFRIGYTPQERRMLEIAYECMCGSMAFYESLGHNPEDVISQAQEIIKNHLSNGSDID